MWGLPLSLVFIRYHNGTTTIGMFAYYVSEWDQYTLHLYSQSLPHTTLPYPTLPYFSLLVDTYVLGMTKKSN